MPPIRGHQDHEWTRFELQTVLSLLCRGVHLSPPPHPPLSKHALPSQIQKSTHLNFATELNLALHGTDYAQDIPKKEVSKMLERVLREKKAVLGLVERLGTGRITRGVRMAWEGNRRADFDGGLGEWRAWRRERVLGLKPEGVGEGGLKEVVEKVITVPSSQPATRVYKKPGRNASHFKSAHTVISDEEESETESTRIRVSGKENLRDVEKLVPASTGYTSSRARAEKTGRTRTPLRSRGQERVDVEIETPGMVRDESSPEKGVATPEDGDDAMIYELVEDGLGKAGRDIEREKELGEELFGDE